MEKLKWNERSGEKPPLLVRVPHVTGDFKYHIGSFDSLGRLLAPDTGLPVGISWTDIDRWIELSDVKDCEGIWESGEIQALDKTILVLKNTADGRHLWWLGKAPVRGSLRVFLNLEACFFIGGPSHKFLYLGGLIALLEGKAKCQKKD